MRKYIVMLLLILPAYVMGQSETVKKLATFRIKNEELKLGSLIKAISGDGSPTDSTGIFQRVIQKIDVDQTETYSKLHKFLPYLELNYIHLKFSDFDSVSCDLNGTPFSIGKVFMSERYIESDYYDRFRKPSDYREDKDGFYYYCKIYFDTKNIEQRLIIYPHFLSNFCRPAMHLNNESCPDSIGRDVHDASIRTLIAIPDTYYGDFLSENSYNTPRQLYQNMVESISAFPKSNETRKVNFDPLFRQTNRDSIVKNGSGFKARLRKNSLPVFVNQTKYMKIFRITQDQETNRIAKVTLTLIHSKKTDSEDFSDNLHYDYNFLRYNEKPLSDEISEFVEFTNNSANRRLVFSEAPDDEFVPGKKRVFNQISFSSSGLTGIDDCRNDPRGFIICLKNLKTTLIPEINGLKEKEGGVTLKLKDLQQKISGVAQEENRTQQKVVSSEAKIEDNKLKELRELKQRVKELLNPENIFATVNSDSSSTVITRSAAENLKSQISEIRNDLMTANNGILEAAVNVDKDKINIKIFVDSLINAETDTSRAEIFRSHKGKITSLLKRINNTADRFLNDEIATTTKRLKGYQETFKALQNEESSPNVTSTQLKGSSPRFDSLQNEKKTESDSLKGIMARLKQLNQDVTQIDREIIKSQTDLSKISGFIYIEKNLVKAYPKNETGANPDENRKLNYFYHIFQKPFYIRKSLPELLPDSTYFKGEISEIYEPFNFDKASVKQRFKALAKPGTGWKKLLSDSIKAVLTKNVWNLMSNDISDSTVYSNDLNAVAAFEMVALKNGGTYYWLRIPQSAVELVPYMNYFFNKRPKRGQPWKKENNIQSVKVTR